jgi:4-aminobutyrate aminotransferase-like enzyme
MKFPVLVVAATVLAGCAAPSASDRSAGPAKVLSSAKQQVAVAQCIQVSWQNESMFGSTADVFIHKLADGGFTVFTTEARYFADVRGSGSGTTVEFYAPREDSQAPLRAAAVATCL